MGVQTDGWRVGRAQHDVGRGLRETRACVCAHACRVVCSSARVCRTVVAQAEPGMTASFTPAGLRCAPLSRPGSWARAEVGCAHGGQDRRAVDASAGRRAQGVGAGVPGAWCPGSVGRGTTTGSCPLETKPRSRHLRVSLRDAEAVEPRLADATNELGLAQQTTLTGTSLSERQVQMLKRGRRHVVSQLPVHSRPSRFQRQPTTLDCKTCWERKPNPQHSTETFWGKRKTDAPTQSNNTRLKPFGVQNNGRPPPTQNNIPTMLMVSSHVA